jgi:hypothetical protein
VKQLGCVACVAIAIAIFVCYEFLLVWKDLSPSGFMSLLKGSSFGWQVEQSFFALKAEVLMCFEDWKTSCCSLGLG